MQLRDSKHSGVMAHHPSNSNDSTTGSVLMIKFDDIWEKPVTISWVGNLCLVSNQPPFFNQCAIRVGNALALWAIDTFPLPGKEHCRHHIESGGRILRAEKLANTLNRVHPPGFGQIKTVSVGEFKKPTAGIKGIVFFKDNWIRTSDRKCDPTGDHVNQRVESRLKDWTSWLRIRMGPSLESYWSDFGKSQEILFWRAQS